MTLRYTARAVLYVLGRARLRTPLWAVSGVFVCTLLARDNMPVLLYIDLLSAVVAVGLTLQS